MHTAETARARGIVKRFDEEVVLDEIDFEEGPPVTTSAAGPPGTHQTSWRPPGPPSTNSTSPQRTVRRRR